ncbi:MAG: transposase [Hyphomicrobiales bacterium]|nr:transposase [Hyphomicrobiales bacterium]
MLEASSDLPDDVAALQAMIALQNEKLSIFEAEIKERDYRIEKLEHQLAGMRRHLFGTRSEALDQLELTLEEEEITRAVETPVGEDASDTSSDTPKGKPKCKPLPDHLPRNDETLSPGNECSACGGSLKTLGEDVTEELEYIPGRFVVNRIIRPRMACSCCEAICQSPLPSRPIEKGRPGPGLLAHVLVNKYSDHLPLYRQSQIFKREGVDLD